MFVLLHVLFLMIRKKNTMVFSILKTVVPFTTRWDSKKMKFPVPTRLIDFNASLWIKCIFFYRPPQLEEYSRDNNTIVSRSIYKSNGSIIDNIKLISIANDYLREKFYENEYDYLFGNPHFLKNGTNQPNSRIDPFKNERDYYSYSKDPVVFTRKSKCPLNFFTDPKEAIKKGNTCDSIKADFQNGFKGPKGVKGIQGTRGSCCGGYVERKSAIFPRLRIWFY